MYRKDEVEIFRTPVQYLEWFDDLLARIHADETIKRDVLTHSGPYKKVYEEMFPLRSLLKLKISEWGSWKFRSILGTQPYDVEVMDGQLKYLEIASTDFDDGERYRMLEFLEKGSVDALGRIVRNENGFPVGIENRGSMRLHNDVIEELIALIVSRIERKSKNTYGADTGLIVYFDDYKTNISPADIARLDQVLHDTATRCQVKFESIFLVGPRAEVCIERKM